MNNTSVKTNFKVVAASVSAFWIVTIVMIAATVSAISGGEGDIMNEEGGFSLSLAGLFEPVYYITALLPAVALACVAYAYRKQCRAAFGATLLAASCVLQLILGLITTSESFAADYIETLEGNVMVTPFILTLVALALNALGSGMLAAKVKGMKMVCTGYAMLTVAFGGVLYLFSSLIEMAMDEEEHSSGSVSIIAIALCVLAIAGLILELVGWWRAKPKQDNLSKQ